jgi:hypothetical protein
MVDKKEYSFLDDDSGAEDFRWAIGEVMKKVHGPGLAGMGMDDKARISSHILSFDSQQNQLEPIYYWILDFAAQIGWGNMKKLIDNFTASPGSGQFGEMSQKASIMQDRFDKMSSGLNQLVKSILNLVYDLKEFELRLAHYDDAKSEDKKVREVGILALKQIWLDNVDIKKQRGAIHSMATMEMGYSTLREAFMMANSQEDIKKMNSDKDGGLLNDAVMRVLQPRLSEFLKWQDYSEKEMRKRFSVEKNYLKSQIETVKLYSSWMKPYLVAAEKLRQQGFEKDAAMVNAFSTTMFELQLFGKQEVKVGSVYDGNYKSRRGYHKVVMITFRYRGHVSQRVTQKGDYGFGMGGVVDMVFDSYALNDEELRAAEEMLKKNDLNKSMEFSLDIAGEALEELKEDLDYFLKSKEERDAMDEESEDGKEKVKGKDINPFAALFGLVGKKSKKSAKKDGVVEIGDIKKDNFVEKMMRAGAIDGAAGTLYTLYDVYKKAHGMASAPGLGFDTHDTGAVESLSEGGDVGIRDVFKGKGG